MDLPGGTVTFLFTDIEGSTRLWQERPELMQIALSRHDTLLTTAAEENGGHVVKTTGDGFHFVFSSAQDAVRTTIATQRVLLAESWEADLGQLRVRMALHTGEAELRGGDYYGPAVNLAARLALAGHGGQILLSQTTRDLVCDELSEDTNLLDLGEVVLKDVFQPQRVFQLSAPGLSLDFPPLKSAGIRPTNLPPQRTPFIGREDELDAVEGLIRRQDVRLVTLTGPGGTGKTRLALQTASRLLAEFEDGVFFVDLAPLSDPELVASSIAGVLGVRESAGIPLIDLIRLHLRPRKILLVIDNFEHLIGAADYLAGLIAASSKTRFLITSREALNLQEEWLYPLTGMPFPSGAGAAAPSTYSAVQLFVQSARRVRPDFSLADEVGGVVHVCQLVGGSPLAIELAASWSKTLDSFSIAAEIERGIDFLATRMRNVPERHRTMRAAFDYSWRQLSSPQRDIFRSLSVFRGGFQLQAAEQVAGSTLLELTNLVDRSLLQWQPVDRLGSPGGRYRVHELLRQYAEEKLNGSPVAAERVRKRHASFYSEFLYAKGQDLYSSKQRQTTAEVTAELDNIRSAWHTAIELKMLEAIRKTGSHLMAYYQFQSRYLEGADEVSRAIDCLENAPPDTLRDTTLAELLIGLGWVQIRLGHLEDAEEAFTRSLNLCQSEDLILQKGGFNNPLAGLGVLANTRGDYGRAEKIGLDALRLARAAADKTQIMDSLYILTNATYALGRYEEARRYGQGAYLMAEQIGDQWMISYILNDLGNIDLVLGHLNQAKENFRRSYDLRESFDDPEGMAVALIALGDVALVQGEYAEAGDLYRRTLATYREIGDQGGLARALDGLGNTATALGDYRTAQERFAEALSISEQIKFVTLTLTTLMDAALWLIKMGQIEEGAKLLTLVLGQSASHQDTRDKAEHSLAQAKEMLSAERFSAAQESGQALDLQTAVATTLQILTTPVAESVVPAQPSRSQLDKLDQPLIDPLTPRELEVLQLIAGGRTNPQIAQELVIAVGTVKSYTAQIYGKLGVNNRVQAVTTARELGLV